MKGSKSQHHSVSGRSCFSSIVVAVRRSDFSQQKRVVYPGKQCVWAVKITWDGCCWTLDQEYINSCAGFTSWGFGRLTDSELSTQLRVWLWRPLLTIIAFGTLTTLGSLILCLNVEGYKDHISGHNCDPLVNLSFRRRYNNAVPRLLVKPIVRYRPSHS